MLVDFQYLNYNKKLAVSFVNDLGNIEIKYITWEDPFKYEVCGESDPYKEQIYRSWDNKPIKKVPSTMPDRYSVYEFLDSLPADEKDVIFKYNNPNTYFIDIETATDELGYSSPDDARTEIQSISIVYDDKIVLLGVKDLSEKQLKNIIKNTNEHIKKFGVEYKLKYIKYNDEFDMLQSFFERMSKKMSCITGWNFLDYDWKFLVNRAKKITKTVNGKEKSINYSECSPTNKMSTIWNTTYEVPSHKLIYDYMLLYKALDQSIKIKESNSLDFVSENVLGLKKIKVVDKAGKPISLMKLYESDFETFMFYNAVDSVLVQLIHNKMRYIDTIFGIGTLAKIKLMDVYSYQNNSLGALAITEGVLRSRFREQFNIILFKDKNRQNFGSAFIEGGYVKEPVKGLNMWVACYDFASLYPTTQREFFIAPENYVGKTSINDEEYCVSNDGKKILIDKNIHVVLSNGSVFIKRNSPTIDMLSSLYNERKADKKVMMGKKKELAEVEKQIKKLKQELAEAI